jgi:sugar lactone lactonase YvrE
MLTRKLKNPYGLALLAGGAVAVAEAGTGKLLRVDSAGQISTLVEGLAQPGEVIATSEGTIFVSEVGKGQISQVDTSGKITVLIDGLSKPQGLALQQNSLLVLDRETKELRAVDLATRKSQMLAHHLPVGDPPGCSRGPMEFSGGLAIGSDGTIYIAGDGEGSVLTLRRV